MNASATIPLFAETMAPELSSQTVSRTARTSLLLTDAFPPHSGGSRTYYYNLYRRLCLDFKHPVIVLTTRVPGWQEFDSTTSSSKFEIIRRSTPLPDWNWKQLRCLLPHLAKTFTLCRSRSIALIHSGDLFPQGLVSFCIKQSLGTPYIAYAHGEEITKMDQRRFQPKLRNLIYHNADAVIAANDFARTHLLRIGVSANRIHTILPGVDYERFTPAPRSQELTRKLGLEGKIVMLSVGRLVAHKGHGLLLEAMAKLPALTPPLHYVIAGVGPELQRLKIQVERLGLSSRVSFLGNVSEAELPAVYNLCDFFALANREVDGEMEGFGMVFLEAGAAGKSVLGGRTGGVEGAVIHKVTGLLFNPENPEEIYQALLEITTSAELRAQLAKQGRERALTQFSWSQAAEHLARVCDHVLAGSPIQDHR